MCSVVACGATAVDWASPRHVKLIMVYAPIECGRALRERTGCEIEKRSHKKAAAANYTACHYHDDNSTTTTAESSPLAVTASTAPTDGVAMAQVFPLRLFMPM